MALQHLRSGTANKRPLPTAMSDGQLAVNTNLASPGLFFKDSNGDIVKVGPVHIGATAPNASPASTAATALVANTIYKILTVGTSDFTAVGAGSNAVGVVFTASGTTTGTGTVSGEQGNEKGEMWLDNTGGAYDLKIYDGTAWRSQAGEFVNATGDTMTGDLLFNNANIVFEGSAADDHETTLTVVNPTADRTITLPNVTGTVVTTGDTGTVTSTMITDGTIVNADVNASAEIAVSKLANGTARQLLQTDSGGTGVEFTSNVDVPGTLDVTGAATFDIGATAGSDTNTANGVVARNNAGSETGATIWAINKSSSGYVFVGNDQGANLTSSIANNGNATFGGHVLIGGTTSVNSDIVLNANGTARFDGDVTVYGDAQSNIEGIKLQSGLITTCQASGQNSVFRANTTAGGDVKIDLSAAGRASFAGDLYVGASWGGLAPSTTPTITLAATGAATFAGEVRVEGANTPTGLSSRISKYGSLLIGTTSDLLAGARASIDSGTGAATFAGDVNIGNSSKNAQLAVGGVYNQVGLAVSAGGASYSNCAEFYNSGNVLAASIGGDGVATFTGELTAGNSTIGLVVLNDNAAEAVSVFAPNSQGQKATIFSNGAATFAGRCDFGSSSVADVSGKFSNSDAASATLYVTNHNSSGTLFSGRNSSNTEVIDLGVDGAATFANKVTAADFDSNHPSDSRFGRFNWAGIRFTNTSGGNVFQFDADAGQITTNVKSAGHIELDSTGSFSSPKVKLFANTGAATFAGTITSGGNPANGSARGTSINEFGTLRAANTSGTVFEGYAVGTGVATSQITTAGGATFLGNVFVGKASDVFATVGIRFPAYGAGEFTRDQGSLLALNRLSTDGGLIDFYRNGTAQGSISVSGSTVSYNGAHLARWSQLPGGVGRTEILRGSVLSNLDEMCEWSYEAKPAVLWEESDDIPEGVSVGDIRIAAQEAGTEDNEQLNRMKISDVEGDRNVAGVFQAWDDDDDTYTNDFYCAMTGDFVIRIAQGTTVARGDLLMSAGDGTAKPQDDDIIRSKTIAKVTSANVSETYADGSYCVPCVLMAC